MSQVFLVLHLIFAFLLICLVLIQHGKGAQTGAVFGSGASKTVFGSQGSGGFLFHLTAFLLLGFFVTSLMLARIAYKEANIDSISELEDKAKTAIIETTEAEKLPE